VSGSSISWAICKSASHPRQITMPAPHHSFFTGWMPFLPPNQQRQSTEGNANNVWTIYNGDMMITQLWPMLIITSLDVKFTTCCHHCHSTTVVKKFREDRRYSRIFEVFQWVISTSVFPGAAESTVHDSNLNWYEFDADFSHATSLQLNVTTNAENESKTNKQMAAIYKPMSYKLCLCYVAVIKETLWQFDSAGHDAGHRLRQLGLHQLPRVRLQIKALHRILNATHSHVQAYTVGDMSP